MKKCTAFAIIIGLAHSSAATSVGASVCDTLLVGNVPTVTKPAPTDPPIITALPIQIYTTEDLDHQLAGVTPPLTHKCAIASDLSEVDVMMEDVGFGGYTGSNVPLFTNTRIRHMNNQSDRNFLRAVARAVIRGDQVAEELLMQLKANTNLYSDRALNIYFVHYDLEFENYDNNAVAFEVKGMHLRDELGETEKIIFFGNRATPGTLAHEFGHAFSNGHVNFEDLGGTEWCTKFLPHNITQGIPIGTLPSVKMNCEFTRKNYMWAGSKEDRQFLGDPQTERMKRNKKSIMYQFHNWDQPLDCPDSSSDPNNGCRRLTQ